MAQGKVEICGVNTAKLPILNEKEKEALFVRIKAGDQEAKEEYIKGNLRLTSFRGVEQVKHSNISCTQAFSIGVIFFLHISSKVSWYWSISALIAFLVRMSSNDFLLEYIRSSILSKNTNSTRIRFDSTLRLPACLC